MFRILYFLLTLEKVYICMIQLLFCLFQAVPVMLQLGLMNILYCMQGILTCAIYSPNRLQTIVAVFILCDLLINLSIDHAADNALSMLLQRLDRSVICEKQPGGSRRCCCFSCCMFRCSRLNCLNRLFLDAMFLSQSRFHSITLVSSSLNFLNGLDQFDRLPVFIPELELRRSWYIFLFHICTFFHQLHESCCFSGFALSG